MPVLTKINTNVIADDAITGAKFAGDTYLENTATQNLTGTYAESRMYTSDAYTLTGDTTVNANLVLSSVKGDDSDITLTADSTTRTLTGTGVLSGGSIVAKVNTDLTGMTGALGSVVTGSPALTGLGTVTSGTLGSGVTFPAGHIVAQKIATYSADASNYISTTSTSWVGTSSVLNITHAMSHADNLLIFEVFSSRAYLAPHPNFLLSGVGLTSDLTTNIIDYDGEGDGPGGQHANGKFWNLYTGQSSEIYQQAVTGTMKHLPATTSSRTYQPIHYASGSGDVQLVVNNTAGYVHFMLMEVVV